MRRILVTTTVLVLALGAVPRGAEAQQASIEAQVLSLVNAGRSRPLVMHAGLVGAARGHSRSMAARGSLTHAGAAARIARAAQGGGYTGTWCENTGYVSGGSSSEVAERIHRGWRQSSSHRRCMQDSTMTAAGVGVHFDGQTWWATMELIEDHSPPRASRPDPDPTPDPTTAAGTPRPASTATTPTPETPDPTPRPPRVPELAVEDASPAAATVGWPELLAAMGILAVMAVAVRIIRLQRV